MLGQVIGVGGLCGLLVIVDDFDIYVMFGDEIVLFVIGCWLEELFVGKCVEVFVEIFGYVDCQLLVLVVEFYFIWLECDGVDVVISIGLEQVLVVWQLFVGDIFYWIVVEFECVWCLCQMFVQCGVMKDCIKVIGYWKVVV